MLTEKEIIEASDSQLNEWTASAFGFNSEGWNPAGDHNDAFALINFLKGDGYHVALHIFEDWCEAEVTCGYGPCKKHGNPFHRSHGAAHKEADIRTALCRASLFAKYDTFEEEKASE